MKTVYFYLLLIFSLQSNVFAQTSLDSLRQTMLEIESQNILPGFAIAIVNPEEILFESGYGYADIEKKTAYTPNTIQNIGSVSKTFIGAAIAKCIEDGLLTLDTKVNDILPFKVTHPLFPNDDIILKHLVTHTSGIQDSPAYGKACYVIKEGQKISRKNYSIGERFELGLMLKSKMMSLGDFLRSYFTPKSKHYKTKNFTKTKPGTEYKYSNISSALAAYMVEVVTEKPFDRYVVDEIMQALNMKSSGYKFEEIDMNQHATLYGKKGGIISKYSLVTYPDGGVLSSTHDLAIYIQQMMKGLYGEGNFISAKSYDTLFQTHFEKEKEKIAIFWAIDKHDFIHHNGADPGIFTYVQIHPEEQFGIILTTNCAAHTNKEQISAVIKIWKTLYKRGKNIK